MRPSIYVLNISAAVLSIIYWFLYITRGDPWIRASLAKAFNVTIVISGKGLWRVLGARSGLGAFAIELLQPATYLAAFAIWGLMMVLAVVLSTLLERP